MKALLVLLLLIVGGVGYLFLGPSGSKGEPAKESAAESSFGESPESRTAGTGGSTSVKIVTKDPSQTSQPAGRALVGGDGFISDAAAVGGYAMGHTQVMVKNRVSEKLKKKNDAHTKKLNDLMN
ncbi:MAG: hypothetical protein HN904_19545 [Victivallales bacterium]|nr:hypothetical protein [Victivallales bacterium]MBT7164981.1 hypothetical protein [Victivallales bacterium]